MRKRIARYFCKELLAQLEAQKQKLAVFEQQKATILMAAIDASERVAFVVSKRGDENLKAYVDECFTALLPAKGAN